MGSLGTPPRARARERARARARAKGTVGEGGGRRAEDREGGDRALGRSFPLPLVLLLLALVLLLARPAPTCARARADASTEGELPAPAPALAPNRVPAPPAPPPPFSPPAWPWTSLFDETVPLPGVQGSAAPRGVRSSLLHTPLAEVNAFYRAQNVTFPLNVTDVFKGKWWILPPPPPPEQQGQHQDRQQQQQQQQQQQYRGTRPFAAHVLRERFALARAAAALAQPRRAPFAWLFRWLRNPTPLDFSHNAGHVVFDVEVGPGSFEGLVDEVNGELLLRDGVYSTDDTIRYFLQGVYLRQAGFLLAIGNPSHSAPLVKNVFVDFLPNRSIADSLRDAEGRTLAALLEEGSGGDSPSSIATAAAAAAASEGEGAAAAAAALPRPAHTTECYLVVALQVHPDPPRAPGASPPPPPPPPPHARGRIRGVGGDGRPPHRLHGFVESPNCGLSMAAEASSLRLDTYFQKVVNYVGAVAVVSFAEAVLFLKQLRHTQSQSALARVSMLSIGQQSIMDSYLCFAHLIAGAFIESAFNAFALVAFFKFAMVWIFQLRYLLAIWKSRRPRSAPSDWDSIRRELGMLLCRFYSIMMGGFLLVYALDHGPVFNLLVFLLYGFFVPQIVRNVLWDSTRALRLSFIVGTALTRFSIPAYFYGCPHNFLHAAPNPKFLLWLFAWLLLQVLVLVSQDVLGARFFLPRRVLPPKYDYRRPFDARGAFVDSEGADCVVCMEPVRLREGNYMITPCNHVFHAEPCLRRWLEEKLECPTCRRQLPPP